MTDEHKHLNSLASTPRPQALWYSRGGQERVIVGVFLKAVLVEGKDSVFALKDCWVIWRFVRLTTSAVDIVYNGGAIWSKGVIEGRWRLGRCEWGYEGEYNLYRWSSEYYSL